MAVEIPVVGTPRQIAWPEYLWEKFRYDYIPSFTALGTPSYRGSLEWWGFTAALMFAAVIISSWSEARA